MLQRRRITRNLSLLPISLVLCLSAFGLTKRGDRPSSNNGTDGGTDCPVTTATPFAAALDGHSVTCSAGTFTYPNLVATFNGNGYKVIITPVLWSNGGASSSADTILQIQVQLTNSTTTAVTVNSLELKQVLGDPGYVACNMPSSYNTDASNANGTTFPYCMNYRLMVVPAVTGPSFTYDAFNTLIQEPNPIVLADNIATRWEFVGFTQDQKFDLVVDGWPNNPGVTTIINALQYSSSGIYNTLDLSAAKVGISTTVNNKASAALGSFVIATPPAATNDLTSNPVPVTAGYYTDFRELAATNPKQDNPATDQGDPVPPCFDGNINTTDKTSIYHSVWYTVTPQNAGVISVSTDGSRFDSRVWVFDGTPLAPGTTYGCDDDSTVVAGLQSDTGGFSVSAADTYWIMVSETPTPVGTLLDSAGDPVVSGGNPVNQLVPSAQSVALRLAVAGSGLDPTPTSENFGIQVLGTTSTPMTIGLKAYGADLTSMSLSTTGDFQISSTTCPSGLVSGAVCTVNITFTPTALGTRTGTLTVPSSGILGPLVVPLSGTGATALAASPLSMSFGTVYVNKNAALNGTITNNTSASAPITPAISPSGTDFSLGTTNCASSLGAHTSCNFQVVFAPTAQRNDSAMLTYTSGANQAKVTLKGTGVFGLGLSSSALAFGTVPVNTSLMQTVSLVNNTSGSIALTVGVSPTGTAFSIGGGTCGSTLPAHTSCTIGVVFAPTVKSLQSATLSVTGGGFTANASLTGTGQ